MMLSFQKLRKHEEGQALILACVSMFVLVMCIVATMNLAHVIREKVRLQNTADSVAYTTAAFHARAMNFVAYANRAMVVHYASQTTLVSYISYLYWIKTVIKLLSLIPVIGGIFAAIGSVFDVVLGVINFGVQVLMPAIDALNMGLAMAQMVTATAAIARPMSNTSGIQGELNIYNAENNTRYEMEQGTGNLWKTAMVLANTNASKQSFLAHDGISITSDMTARMFKYFQNQAPASKTNGISSRERIDLVQMVEIANASRPGWSAIGSNRNGQGSIPILARWWEWGFDLLGVISLGIGHLGRSEMGLLEPVNNPQQRRPVTQMYGGDRFYIRGGVMRISLTIGFSLEFVYDRFFPNNFTGALSYNQNHGRFGINTNLSEDCGSYKWYQSIQKAACYVLWAPLSFLKPIINGMGPVLSTFIAPMLGLGVGGASPKLRYHFGAVPYVSYNPYKTNSRNNLTVTGSNLFNQPVFVVMLRQPDTEVAKSGKPFMSTFKNDNNYQVHQNSGMQMDTANCTGLVAGCTGTTMGRKNMINYTSGRSFQNGGIIFTLGDNTGNNFQMQPGLHVASAAMAYYHRPGDWREPPNLFSPFWGAKLAPVMDSPLNSIAILNQFITH